jgi:intracellular multiplication protein IcmT
MARRNVDAHWRDSARRPRIFIIDARATFPLVLFLLHIQWWTAIVAVIATLFFAILQRYFFTLEVFLRWLRSLMAGPRKMAMPWWKQ